ncbi:hypothetical protein ABPG75_002285 [Micractinium tetrahymenae]
MADRSRVGSAIRRGRCRSPHLLPLPLLLLLVAALPTKARGRPDDAAGPDKLRFGTAAQAAARCAPPAARTNVWLGCCMAPAGRLAGLAEAAQKACVPPLRGAGQLGWASLLYCWMCCSMAGHLQDVPGLWAEPAQLLAGWLAGWLAVTPVCQAI